MEAALDGRSDIFPPVTLGTGIENDPKLLRESLKGPEPKKKKNAAQKPKKGDDAIERCLTVIEDMARKQIENEKKD